MVALRNGYGDYNKGCIFHLPIFYHPCIKNVIMQNRFETKRILNE